MSRRLMATIARASAKRLRTVTRVIAHRPKELSLWTATKALVNVGLARPLRVRRAARIPYDVTSIDEEHVRQARVCGRGVIFVSFHSIFPHVSQSWFYNAVHEEDWPIHAVTWTRTDTTLHTFNRVFSSVIFTPEQILKAARALHRGEAIVLMQDVLNDGGTPIAIFDRSARFQLGAARLAQMTDSVILPYTALMRHGKGAVRWWPVIDPRDCDVASRLSEAMATMIHAHPSSWKRLTRFLATHDPDPSLNQSRPVR